MGVFVNITTIVYLRVLIIQSLGQPLFQWWWKPRVITPLGPTRSTSQGPTTTFLALPRDRSGRKTVVVGPGKNGGHRFAALGERWEVPLRVKGVRLYLHKYLYKYSLHIKKYVYLNVHEKIYIYTHIFKCTSCQFQSPLGWPLAMVHGFISRDLFGKIHLR